MENIKINKETAAAFSRFIEKQFGFKNIVILPSNPSEPLFDAKLVIDGGDILYLQMKQIMKFESTQKILTRSNIKFFENQPFEPIVKKAENKYKDKARELILILHVDIGIILQSDIQFINLENFTNSTFRGIYLVSPKQELWSAENGKEVLDEFVFEIKEAFK